MASLEEIKEARHVKLERLRSAGMNPYPASVQKTHTVFEANKQFEDIEKKKNEVSLAGRVTAIRGQGSILFVVLREGKDVFQAVFKKDFMEDSLFDLFEGGADMGDFVSVTGGFFVTDRGQKSLLVKSWQMATKSLLPLPDKYRGTEDEDLKIRKRFLEIATRDEVYDRFVLRSDVVTYIRKYLEGKGMMEVETPILQMEAGGTMAKKFETYHNALGQTMELRIALELDHKILMAAGYPGVYEIGKCFRNEGVDPMHLPEFTMLEWYKSFATLEENMNWTQEMIQGIAKEVAKKDIFVIEDKNGVSHNVDFGGTWKRVRFGDLLLEHAGLDLAVATLEEIKEKAASLGASHEEIKTTGEANLLDFIYKKTARPTLIQPTFVTNYPSDLKPLAIPNNDKTAEVAQLLIAGAEITNQYGELVDPVVQRSLLEKQAAAKELGDDEAMSVDERFLGAMEHGMPPMTGFGMGIDRLMAILTEQYTIRDVIFFPPVKPNKKEKAKREEAVIVISSEANLEMWQNLNAVAHLSAAFGARSKPEDLFTFDSVSTSDGKDISMNIKNAIMIKVTDSSQDIKDLKSLAIKRELKVSEFTREMLDSGNDKKIKAQIAEILHKEVEHLGILIYGESEIVRNITKDFKLFS